MTYSDLESAGLKCIEWYEWAGYTSHPLNVMKSWSISIGRIFRVELRLHLTFLLLLAIVLVTESASQGAAGAWRGLALVGIILLSVLFHELGHLMVAKGAGVPARSIILLPIGGVTLMDESRLQNSGITPGQSGVPIWKRDIRIAIAGPLVNLAIAFLVGSILLAVAPQVGLTTRPLLHSSHLLRSLFWANLSLAVFNLLPAYPMDGGRVLRALFSRSMEMVRATRRAVTVGQSFAVFFMLGGMLWNFLFGGAVWTLWLTLLGFFLFVGTQLEERSVVFQSVLEKVCMEDVMLTDFATLSPADTLEDALEKAVHSLQDDFPVVRGSDMVGVVSKQSILQTLRAQGNGYVQAVMSRVFDVAQRRESLASAFRKITARGLTIIPVVEDQRLVGIVTLQNLMHSMALLAETRKLRREALNS